MATKQQVLELHAKNPKLTCIEIAKKLDCMAEYVRKTFYREGVAFVRGKPGRKAAI